MEIYIQRYLQEIFKGDEPVACENFNENNIIMQVTFIRFLWLTENRFDVKAQTILSFFPSS